MYIHKSMRAKLHMPKLFHENINFETFVKIFSREIFRYAVCLRGE